MAHFKSDDPDAEKKMKAVISPVHIDQTIRQAMQLCWMMLPADNKTVAELEKQFRRIVERAIQNLHEDAEAFGIEE